MREGLNVVAEIIISTTAGVLLVALVVLLVRGVIRKRRQRKQSILITRAAEQMRETALLLSLGSSPDPAEVATMQRHLAAKNKYHGEINGIPSKSFLAALRADAEEHAIDLDEIATSLVERPKYLEVLPAPVRQDFVLRQAQERLENAQAAVVHPSRRKNLSDT